MNFYRANPKGKVDMVVGADQLPFPKGVAFSPDYKRVYIVSRGDLHSFDVGGNYRLSNQKLFSEFMIDGVKCGTDGIRVDADGNVWYVKFRIRSELAEGLFADSRHFPSRPLP